jgi:N-acetylmuramoyl-L-alanine amidase
MGSLKGDIATLTTNHVSVPFVIARNGIIYNLFASKYWSYHLGAGAVGGNTAMSKESIGIELSNIGPLKRINGNLVTTYADTDVYCKLDEHQYYSTVNPGYRGYQYFAKFTQVQYNALSLLIRFLCARYNIPKIFQLEADRYEIMTADGFRSFSGVVSHVSCRRDKTDIGPAFDWDRIV